MNSQETKIKYGVSKSMRSNMIRHQIITSLSKITGEDISSYKEIRKKAKKKIRSIQKKKLDDSRTKRRTSSKPRKRNKDGKVRGTQQPRKREEQNNQ